MSDRDRDHVAVPMVLVSVDQLRDIVSEAVRAALPDRSEPAAWLSTEEVGAMLGVHPDTVGRMARLGEIPCSKLGRVYRFERGALARWMAERAK